MRRCATRSKPRSTDPPSAAGADRLNRRRSAFCGAGRERMLHHSLGNAHRQPVSTDRAQGQATPLDSGSIEIPWRSSGGGRQGSDPLEPFDDARRQGQRAGNRSRHRLPLKLSRPGIARTSRASPPSGARGCFSRRRSGRRGCSAPASRCRAANAALRKAPGRESARERLQRFDSARWSARWFRHAQAALAVCEADLPWLRVISRFPLVHAACGGTWKRARQDSNL